MPTFKELDPREITVVHQIGQEWMLITAGKERSFNPMTASWGGLGFLWNRPVCFVFIRPQRYTFGIMEKTAHFSLSFFGDEHRDILNFCGTKSGRNVDKVAATGLTPVVGESGAVYFAEASRVLECRKLYAQDLQEANFIDPTIPGETYAAGDYHRLYVGELLHYLVRQETP